MELCLAPIQTNKISDLNIKTLNGREAYGKNPSLTSETVKGRYSGLLDTAIQLRYRFTWEFVFLIICFRSSNTCLITL